MIFIWIIFIVLQFTKIIRNREKKPEYSPGYNTKRNSVVFSFKEYPHCLKVRNSPYVSSPRPRVLKRIYPSYVFHALK